MDSLKQEGGLGATKELRQKYRDNPAFLIEEENENGSMKKRMKTAATPDSVFKLPVEKPELSELRIEPKEYFKFIKSQKKHLSHRESDG